VTFEASIEFLKTDPLGLLKSEPGSPPPPPLPLSPLPPLPSSATMASSIPRYSIPEPRVRIHQESPCEENQVLLWGTPSQTGWGFSPPKSLPETPSYELETSRSEKTVLSASVDTVPTRPPLSIRLGSDYSHPFQQRHARSASMNFDDRLRRVTYGEDASGSSNNSSWSRSPMLGPRFTSGTSSPLNATSPNHGVFGSTEASPGSLNRRSSYQLQHTPQRHTISGGQVQMYNAHRMSTEQGRESMSRSTIVPLPSPSMTPQLVVKPQIMLPPPKTPPMGSQNTTGRARPMSMVVVGALASSAYSSSYGGSGAVTSRRSFSSNHSSPATSPRLGPGSGRRPSGSRSNSLLSGAFPILRANSTNAPPPTEGDLSLHENAETEKPCEQPITSSPVTPVSPIPLWESKPVADPVQLPVPLSSPPQANEPSVLSEPTALVTADPPASEKSQNTRIGSKAPGRIRTSSTSTMSSVSIPTTPSTFSSASGSALLESLNMSAQLASKPTHALDAVSETPPPTPTCTSGSVRSRSSVRRRESIRLSMPGLSLAPSAPSTAFCKTTVTAAATHATTSIDDLEPTSTVLATDQYGEAALPSMTQSAMLPNGRTSLSDLGSATKTKEAVGTHPKAENGKVIVGQHGGFNNHSTSSGTSSGTSTYSSRSKNRNSIAIMDHFNHGTTLGFEQGLKSENLRLESAQVSSQDRRRGSTTSLKSAKSINNFQPEKMILLWNHPSKPTGCLVDNHPNNSKGTKRLSMSGDRPLSSYSRPQTPMTGSFILEDSPERTRQMMGDFLSELTKVDDVLVGNGRDSLMNRRS